MWSSASLRPPRRWWLFVGLAAAMLALLVALFVLRIESGVGAYGSFGLFGGLLLVFFVIWIVFFLVRMSYWTRRARFAGGRGAGRVWDPAIAEARQRYARGEITREQYQQILRDLFRGRPPPPEP